MRVHTIETPALTGKIWDNELFRLTDHVRGDCHSSIMNDIRVGDTYFDGVGTEHICINTLQVEADTTWRAEQNQEIGQNWRVEVQPVTKKGKCNRAVKTNVQVFFYGWSQENK